MEQGIAVKGRWFGGDRTIEQQLMGLEPLFEEIRGKYVLDVGCAEGAISLECMHRGAATVTGLEIRRDAVAAANCESIKRGLRLKTHFVPADVNDYITRPGAYSVVLMLAVLHKLRDPSAVCRRFAAAATDLVVIRLPPKTAPAVIDARSGHVPHNIDAVMVGAGFHLDLQHSGYTGPLGEWMGYYRRQA